MDLSVIIVSFNVKYFLEQCLCSVSKACKNIEAEIFVVDNHSSDGSRKYLEQKFPEVIFKWKTENAGFAKACNLVIDETKAGVVLFLNPDTILPEDCFDKCLSFIKSADQFGALGVKMIDGSGHFLKESKRGFPSPLASFFKLTGFAMLFPKSKIFSRYYAGHLPENEINETDVLAGAYLMINRKALECTGGFDEAFFMYAEDIDLSYRVRQAGFKNYYYPDTTIVHFKGESTQRDSGLYIERFYGAMRLFVKKLYPEKKLTRIFMMVAINLNKYLAHIKLGFAKLNPVGKTDSKQHSKGTLVVADQVAFNDLLGLIKHAVDPLVIQGRISPGIKEELPSAGDLTDIEQIISANKTSTIILCEEPLTFKSMISLVEKLKDKVNCMFHAKHSESIAGSNDKNKNGVFIAKPVRRQD